MSRVPRALALLILIPLVVIVALVAALAIGAEALWGVWLRVRFRHRWGPNRIALLVYSDSPHWKAYVEERWLARIGDRVVVLNWSERSTWRQAHPLEAAVFRHYAGARAFNPIAIVFPDGGRAEVVRFWQPFRDFRHGKDHTLRLAEERLGSLLGVRIAAGELEAA